MWLPPGRGVDVLGFPLRDGLVYVGQGLLTQSGATEPALIDPSLPLDRRNPDWAGDDLFYWPTYDGLSPRSRTAYLTWLADGRRHPGVPLGYVFLFFYGLERRVLVDALGGDPAARAELPVIEQEVRRLLALYGGSNSLDRYAGEFLDVLQLAQNGPAHTPPNYGAEDRWDVPLELRLGLARFAVECTPVPVDWALSWSWFHPDIYPRTPQTRCPDEFTTLFGIRYRERHGDGLLLARDRPGIRMRYSPASSGLLGTDIELHGVPDLLQDPAPTRALKTLVDGVTQELDAFSRHVGRYPDQRDGMAAAALLPSVLATTAGGPVDAFLSWARGVLGTDASAVTDGSELIGFWPTATPGKMAKKEVVACAQLLEQHGIGIEPDVRLGGPVVGPGPVVLFDAGDDPPRSAGPEYSSACTLLQLAVAVGGADGTVDPAEQEAVLDHLATNLDLSPGEQERLIAHLHWLTTAGSKLTGLTKRLQALPTERRSAMADVLVTVAAADGVISADEVKVLAKIYKMLGLDPDAVYSTLHSRTTSIITAEAPPNRRHSRSGIATAPPRPARAATPGVVALDASVLAASAASTAAVSSLLTEVFDDAVPERADEAIAASAEPDQTTGDAPIVDGLDAAHSRLLSAVLKRAEWPRAEFDELAQQHGLLPDGALDTLNDLAYRLCDEPLLEGDDDLVLNDYAVQEIPR